MRKLLMVMLAILIIANLLISFTAIYIALNGYSIISQEDRDGCLEIINQPL